MTRERFVCLSIVLVAVWFGCSVKLVPKPHEISESKIPPIAAVAPVDVLPEFSGRPDHEVTVPMVKVTVNDDEFTQAVVERLIEELRRQGVQVVAGAEKQIAVGVERVTIVQATMGSTHCILDCGLKLGDASPRWLQPRRGSRNYERACGAAASQAVIEILKDEAVRHYLQE